jgi:hypothetical protein
MTASRARTAAAVALFLFLALPVAGCRDDLTQVVLVIESDLSVPSEVDGVDVLPMAGPFAPSGSSFFGNDGMHLQGFPVALGFVSSGKTADFSFVVRFFQGVSQSPTPMLVVRRAVTDVRFVDQKTMMLDLQMLRVCACSGSTCPAPGNPACDDINQPPLVPFDPTVAPPSTNMPVPGGSGGGPIFN